MGATEQVWERLEKGFFAVVAYVNPDGRPRSSGVVYAVSGRRLFAVVAPDSWKARQIADGDQVAVTVPVRRGGLLSLVAPVPPATVTFRATATLHPRGSVRVDEVSRRLATLVPKSRRDGCVLELAPVGSFLTYGLGVSLRAMTRPAEAQAHVPVG
jgi:hypothetical protein